MSNEFTPYQSIVLIGKTGCGKGTQAARLAQDLRYQVFSTGDRIRRISATDTPLGRRIKAIHVSGWVPEWLATYIFVKALLEEFLESGVVFESVARKLEEAKKLHEMHTMLERPYLVIYLDASDEVVMERMQKRQRDDSDLDANIKKRIEAFYAETVASIDYFKQEGKVVTIDADRGEDEVYADILKAVTT